MNLYLLSLLFLVNTSISKTPNFYPSYIAAREASKNYQKDLLIFFSKNSCSPCDAAWGNFEKDQLATKIFISTLVDMQDFDGAVIMDKYGLNSAPSWVILDAEGNLKDKWAGEWKNPHIRPSATEEQMKSESNPEPKPVPVFKPTLANNDQAPASNIKATPEKENPKTMPVVESEKTVVTTPPAPLTPKAEVNASDYVLQAGYFGSEANALKLVNDLRVKGYEHYSIRQTPQNGATYYRVISGTFTSEAEANKEVQTLSVSGVKATVKKLTDL